MRSSSVSSATKGILFLGVPHAGTKTAFGASLLSCTAYWRGSSSALLEYMAPGQPAIVALESRFYDTYVKKSSDSERPLPYICDFLEMRSERLGGLLLGPVSRYIPDTYFTASLQNLNHLNYRQSAANQPMCTMETSFTLTPTIVG